VADVAQLEPDKPVCVTVSGQEILLVWTGGELLAIANQCPHLGHRLDTGQVRAATIQCTAHGWRFDLREGCVSRCWWTPPGSRKVRARLTRYRVVVDGQRVLVEVPS
jgi:nitrite reductase/ring-hydroxylating ferredoxin subunit